MKTPHWIKSICNFFDLDIPEKDRMPEHKDHVSEFVSGQKFPGHTNPPCCPQKEMRPNFFKPIEKDYQLFECQLKHAWEWHQNGNKEREYDALTQLRADILEYRKTLETKPVEVIIQEVKFESETK